MFHSFPTRSRPRLRCGFTLLILSALCSNACAQNPDAGDLAERSAIIVQGKVLKTHASDEPLLAASDRTAVIAIDRMYAGQNIAGDQTGRNATVILSRAGAVEAGQDALFFGNPRFAGRTLTIADEGEIMSRVGTAPQEDATRGMKARSDRPVAERLAIAALVFRGTVESIRPLEQGRSAADKTREPTSEHDPQWQQATVRITTPLRDGRAGDTVTVLFSGSDDIVWFNAPKLKLHQDAVFIAHVAGRSGDERTAPARMLHGQRMYEVTAPADVLPPQDEARVRELLVRIKENRP